MSSTEQWLPSAQQWRARKTPSSIVTAAELERRVQRALAAMRGLSSVQRDVVVKRILESDPALERVLPGLLAHYEHAKWVGRLPPLVRDGVM